MKNNEIKTIKKIESSHPVQYQIEKQKHVYQCILNINIKNQSFSPDASQPEDQSFQCWWKIRHCGHLHQHRMESPGTPDSRLLSTGWSLLHPAGSRSRSLSRVGSGYREGEVIVWLYDVWVSARAQWVQSADSWFMMSWNGQSLPTSRQDGSFSTVCANVAVCKVFLPRRRQDRHFHKHLKLETTWNFLEKNESLDSAPLYQKKKSQQSTDHNHFKFQSFQISKLKNH